jgi:hypothetical protein
MKRFLFSTLILLTVACAKKDDDVNPYQAHRGRLETYKAESLAKGCLVESFKNVYGNYEKKVDCSGAEPTCEATASLMQSLNNYRKEMLFETSYSSLGDENKTLVDAIAMALTIVSDIRMKIQPSCAKPSN